MGMFDSFFFEDGVLPDNKEPANCEFQTKDLECALDVYKVSKDGTITKFYFESRQPIQQINDTIIVYSYKYEYNEDYTLKYQRSQEYEITIVNSKVVGAEKLEESGYVKEDEDDV